MPVASAAATIAPAASARVGVAPAVYVVVEIVEFPTRVKPPSSIST